jgi:hypothetical protein
VADAGGLTLTTVARFGLGVQAWAGEDEPVSERLPKPSLTAGPRSKPHDGFYTCSFRAADASTAWVDHMKVRGQRSGSGRRLWTLAPDPDATLYVIDDKADYEELSLQYPKRWDLPVNSPEVAPDWNRIANLVDGQINGIHATEFAASSSWLWGWDVESTLWLEWSFVGEPVCVADIGVRWELLRRDA